MKTNTNAPDIDTAPEFEPAAPEMPLAFDDDHRPIAVSHPMFETMDEERDEDAAGRREIIAGLLHLLTSGKGDCAATGRRLLVVAYLSNAMPDCKTHAALAKRLNISPGRVTQIIREIKGILPSLAGCNSRQRKKN